MQALKVEEQTREPLLEFGATLGHPVSRKRKGYWQRQRTNRNHKMLIGKKWGKQGNREIGHTKSCAGPLALSD